MPIRTAENDLKTRRAQRAAEDAARAEHNRRFWIWCDLHDRAISRAVALFDQLKAAGPDEAPDLTRRWLRAWRASSRCLDRIYFYHDACVTTARKEQQP